MAPAQERTPSRGGKGDTLTREASKGGRRREGRPEDPRPRQRAPATERAPALAPALPGGGPAGSTCPGRSLLLSSRPLPRPLLAECTWEPARLLGPWTSASCNTQQRDKTARGLDPEDRRGLRGRAGLRTAFGLTSVPFASVSTALSL